MKASENIFPLVEFSEEAEPSNPTTDQVRLYAKADGLLYSKDDAGTETLVSGGGGGGSWGGISGTLADQTDLQTALDGKITDTLTTAGDILFLDGSGYQRLGIGSDDQVLTLVSGLPAWADASGGGGSSPWGDIIYFWPLASASGDRIDLVAGLEAADTNSVTSAPGKTHRLACQFTASNAESLVVPAANFGFDDESITVAAWVYLDDKSATRQILGTYVTAADERSFELRYDQSNDAFRILVSADGTSGKSTAVEETTLGSPSVDTWYFVQAYFDIAANGGDGEVGIRVNDGAWDTETPDSGENGIHPSSADFEIGGRGSGGTMDGRIQDAMIFAAAKSTADMNAIYNSGGGLRYPFY